MGEWKDKAKGLTNQAAGNVKQAVGRATGDSSVHAEGVAQESKGELQQTVGKAKGKVKDAIDRL